MTEDTYGVNDYVRALVVPHDGKPYTIIVPQICGDTIRAIVGGHFDCAPREHIHGYVHDEGILIGLPRNQIASYLLDRHIAGNAILFGNLNARGEHDGYEHHIDPFIVASAIAGWEVYSAREGL